MTGGSLPLPLLLAGLGALGLLVSWLPLVLDKAPLSLPIICVALGAALFAVPGVPEVMGPLSDGPAAEHLTELTILVALMGAGLKLDRPPGLRGWTATWRLLGITMPLSIGVLALVGWRGLGLGFGAALLLASALSPTDPVLAGDVQVGPPGQEETDEVRFSLTSEAGLNDASAFPFVLLALGIVGPDTTWLSDWLLVDLLLKTAVGVAVGVVGGRLLGWAAFRLPEHAQLSRTEEGFVSLAATLLIYGICELLHGYGFLAVFLAGVAFRHTARRHRFHHHLHGFTASLEHMLTMVVLLLLGGALAHDLLHDLHWSDVGYALLALLVIRPAAGMLALLRIRHQVNGKRWNWDERLMVSVFGVRGIGSLYYLVYALNRHHWPEAARLQAIVGFTVLLSILLHGVSATPLMAWLERRREHRPDYHLT
ncbi:MAG: cation:proton antiporter [Gluconacetobacter diazotrophicus]|nr:cation:proton antiporter [Gluconacetobacter diazotrophicus]